MTPIDLRASRGAPAPTLPEPRGPRSGALVDYLAGRTDHLPSAVRPVADVVGDDDLQLALYVAYELHHRGYDVGRDHEWDPEVLRFRAELERTYEAGLRAMVPLPAGALDPDVPVAAALEGLVAAATGPSLSSFVATEGTLDHLREFAVHRSIYQLKEADGHTWAIPRYDGPSRSALIEIQMDEYGNGVPGRAHAELFADTMDELGLDRRYGAYVDRVGAPTLATNTLLSLFGLHRRLLPALLGHLAVFEMTSVVPMGRYATACDRLVGTDRARRFYEVHVEADEHHGPLARDVLAGCHVERHPEDRALLLWGAAALMAVEERFARSLLEDWRCGRTSLRPA